MDADAKFLIDGEEAFAQFAQSLKEAKKSIYMTGWWLTPQYYLIRNGTNEEIAENRLDKILKDRAKAGVKIYIIIWLEVEKIVPTKSEAAKKYLESLHPNIQVERQTSYMKQLYSWTHHQKTIIIDEKIAFVGGLDVCLHRWDTSSHPITDTYARALFPGRDYYNPRVTSDNDAQNDKPFQELNSMDKGLVPRMGWHDVHVMVKGSAAIDVSYNFIQRWNFFSKTTLPLPTTELPPAGAVQCQVVRSIGRWSLG